MLKKKALYLFNNIKNIKQGIKRRNGRNNQGRITVWNRGGGKKIQKIQTNFNITQNYNKYRYMKSDIIHIFNSIYNKTASIAYVKNTYYKNTQVLFKYASILCTKSLKSNDVIYNYTNSSSINWQILYNQIKPGNILCLKNIPVGTLINNIELHNNKGSQIVRAAGTYAEIIKQNILKNKIYIKLKSNTIIQISATNRAVIGMNSNSEHNIIKLHKAGDARNLGHRPHVRGVAMNVVDHPHGSSGGKNSGGRCSVTPWGKLTKGKKTNLKRKYVKI